MTIDAYSTSTQMLADYPDLRITAIHYRLARLLGTEAGEAASSEPQTEALLERWHALQLSEAHQRTTSTRQTDRRTAVHRQQMRAAKRREAARCAVVIPRSA